MAQTEHDMPRKPMLYMFAASLVLTLLGRALQVGDDALAELGDA